MMRPAIFPCLLLFVSGAALAQSTALKGLDTSGPIDFDAARIEVQDLSNTALLTGAVVIRQGKLTLNADTVKVLYSRKPNSDPEMQRLDARGNVKLTSPSERATSRTGIYDVGGKLITLSGDVVLDRGGSTLRGQRLVLDLASGRTSFDGNPAASATAPGSPGRVTGRFLVPERAAKPQ